MVEGTNLADISGEVLKSLLNNLSEADADGLIQISEAFVKLGEMLDDSCEIKSDVLTTKKKQADAYWKNLRDHQKGGQYCDHRT